MGWRDFVLELSYDEVRLIVFQARILEKMATKICGNLALLERKSG